ncbi:GNAT family N-acetyltransferase [Halpernia sp. GG3]
MEFEPVVNFSDSRVKIIFKSYCNTFPENERRSEAQFEHLFQQKKVKLFSILNVSDFIGYLIIWQLDDFIFLEHFEIFKEFRNQQFGAKVLKRVTEVNPHVILETEPELLNDDSKRRIKFYDQNGFHQISDSYIQPSYGEGKESLKLLLFANFQPQNLERIIKNIYDVAYADKEL